MICYVSETDENSCILKTGVLEMNNEKKNKNSVENVQKLL